ncbi:hypothetical protein BAZMOX_486537_0 [methanotrophic endosymbiont of Bathymodiolus azoricus (Menez Gwen)]|nr:hypothetical protein BAZMOX_486537_0 [methanotrophic endosymbiont of Bathymodiolus azoricus (Menez Gwen)]
MCAFKADHDFILCALGNKDELSQNSPINATENPQLTYACDSPPPFNEHKNG